MNFLHNSTVLSLVNVSLAGFLLWQIQRNCASKNLWQPVPPRGKTAAKTKEEDCSCQTLNTYKSKGGGKKSSIKLISSLNPYTLELDISLESKWRWRFPPWRAEPFIGTEPVSTSPAMTGPPTGKRQHGSIISEMRRFIGENQNRHVSSAG